MTLQDDGGDMIFGSSNDNVNPSVGTTTPVFIPGPNGGNPVRPGRDYFVVQVIGAQAAFRGSFWTRVKRLLVASNVSINRASAVKESVRSLQRAIEVKPDSASKLGLRPNLIGLVPAVMTDFSLSIEFILDTEDRLQTLIGLINDDSFLATFSLAPGAAGAARLVGGLAQKIIQSFLPAHDQVPILMFAGDFNLTPEGSQTDLREGNYVILGTRDTKTPLPDPSAKLDVIGDELLCNGEPVTEVSYVILSVKRIEARTRELNEGAGWEAKLREAEDEARLPVEDNPDLTWKKCRGLLREAQALLRADANYLRQESDEITLTVIERCHRLIFGNASRLGDLARRHNIIQPEELAEFGLTLTHADIATVLDKYADRVRSARDALRRIGIS
jgi:hypothetical protein